jgi:hypothetical protein
MGNARDRWAELTQRWRCAHQMYILLIILRHRHYDQMDNLQHQLMLRWQQGVSLSSVERHFDVDILECRISKRMQTLPLQDTLSCVDDGYIKSHRKRPFWAALSLDRHQMKDRVI